MKTPAPQNKLFSPVVKFSSSLLGQKKFNSIRGKAISIHSQVITFFCKYVGADQKIRQGLIRVAKKNGDRLGLLE
jgi:hypothetical protein